MQRDSRWVLFVLGAGRSGSSLLMQILVGLGAQVSNRLIPANVSNPEGFYEDADIKDIQADLYTCLNVSSYSPLPEKWLETKCARGAKLRLNSVLQGLLDESSAILAIKDPRISTLLPLWVSLFNPLRVVPCYLMAVRQPQSVITSYMRQYNTAGHIAELIWLLRMLESLENTAADCFITHYEDWFADPVSLAQDLLHYTELKQEFKGNLTEVLGNIVKPNLNRARKDDYEIQNPYVAKLYAVLQTCHGADFDRERLMVVVKECRSAMEAFKGWHQLAHQANMKLANTRTQLDKANAEAAKVKALEARIQALETEKASNKEWAHQLKKLERQVEHLLTIKFDNL